MVVYETECPCCQQKITFDINGWFILKESLGELISSVAGDGTTERPADVPLMGMCTTACPQCRENSMIDFQMDPARYLHLVGEHYPGNIQKGEEVEDNDFFATLSGDLSLFASEETIDVTCLA